MLIELNELDLTNKVYKNINAPCLETNDYIHNVNKFTLNAIDKYNLSRRYKDGGSCIAGGSICRQVFMLPSSDIDVFFWGISEEDVINLIREICCELNVLYCYRTKNCICVIVKDNENIVNLIQFILMIYESEYDIISGFDMDSSCALISYNKKCYVSERGKLSFETRTNIFRPEYRGAYYEIRLIKYLELGFKFIMPNLNISKINKCLCLPKYLNNLKIISIRDNFISVSRFQNGDVEHSYDINIEYEDNILIKSPNSMRSSFENKHKLIDYSGDLNLFRLKYSLVLANVANYIYNKSLKLLMHDDINSLLNNEFHKNFFPKHYHLRIHLARSFIINNINIQDNGINIDSSKGKYSLYDFYHPYDGEQEIYDNIVDELNILFFPIKILNSTNPNKSMFKPLYFKSHDDSRKEWYGDFYVNDTIKDVSIISNRIICFKNYQQIECIKKNYYDKNSLKELHEDNGFDVLKHGDDIYFYIDSLSSYVNEKLYFFDFLRRNDLLKNYYKNFDTCVYHKSFSHKMEMNFDTSEYHNSFSSYVKKFYIIKDKNELSHYEASIVKYDEHYSLYYVYKNYPNEVCDSYFKHTLSDRSVMMKSIHKNIYKKLFPSNIKCSIEFYKKISKYILPPTFDYSINYVNLYNECCIYLGNKYMNYANLILIITSLVVENYYSLNEKNKNVCKYLYILSNLNLDCQISIINISSIHKINFNNDNLMIAYERFQQL